MVTVEEKLEELKTMQSTDEPARVQRHTIEKELEDDPYLNHLYGESAFEQMMVIELRRQTSLLQTIVTLLSDERKDTRNCKPSPVGESIAQLMFEHNEGPSVKPGESLAKESVVLHADANESKKTTPRKSTTKKKQTGVI